MEENLSPASPDLSATESCKNELTRSNSRSSSFTVENPKHTFHQNAYQQAGKCTAWTDEKHNLYLDRLEASFVEQLHRSMGLLAWSSEQNRRDPVSTPKLSANPNNPSEQFTIRQDGCWRKINFERNQPLLDTAVDSHLVIKSPWIRHFRYAGKRCTRTSADLQDSSRLPSAELDLRGKKTSFRGLATNLGQIPVSHRGCQDLGASIAEVSDQNFVDGDQEEKSGSLSRGKRLKTAVTEASSQDQIVPSGKFKLSLILHQKENNKNIKNGYQKNMGNPPYQNLM